MTLLATDGFSSAVSQRMSAEAVGLSADWLVRLRELLPVGMNEVFPSDQILDHIPALIGEIAAYLQAPADEEIAANAAVIEKARELGVLRHQQQASVHQLLREFEILGEILEAFVVAEAARILPPPSIDESFEILRRVTRATRSLMRTTVDTFIAEYTSALQERNDRLKAFNRMASHELRTPLGTLIFASAALEQPSVRTDEARLTKVTTAIRKNAQRLAQLVENLQRIAGLADNSDAPNIQTVDLAVLAAEVSRQLDEMAGARGVAIVIGEGLPTITADPARLELILMNLVSNAIKYSDMRKPERTVEITASGSDDPGRAAFVVRDNGIGVPDDLRSAIFERFTRAHPELDETLGVSGSGLGLAIVAECVEASGGTISCESSLDVGTVFRVTLPVQPAPSPKAG